jgi:hypothetical protein
MTRGIHLISVHPIREPIATVFGGGPVAILGIIHLRKTTNDDGPEGDSLHNCI